MCKNGICMNIGRILPLLDIDGQIIERQGFDHSIFLPASAQEIVAWADV